MNETHTIFYIIQLYNITTSVFVFSDSVFNICLNGKTHLRYNIKRDGIMAIPFLYYLFT